MNDKTIVGVAGSGAMGTGIAHVAAAAGHPVILMDSNPFALNRSKESLQKDLGKQIEKKKINRNDADALFGRINFVSTADAFSSCGMVIEAIVEDLSAKKSLLASVENVVGADCIIGTNTSSLSVISVASACMKRERVMGIHFFNPAVIMPLVEIIPAFTTNDKYVREARDLIDSWGKVTVLAKDTPGFIVNRIARPFYSEAIRMYEEGIASFATIDWAMKEFGGFRMGPFELMDFIGNDINYKVTETVWEQMFYDPRYKPSLTQKRLYEAGLFGRKSGKGYYDYRTDATPVEPDRELIKGKYIFERILAMLINEAADALYLKIASREDIETAMSKGVNYPKGLFRWADEIGIDKILLQLQKLRDDYQEERYRPSLLLKKMSAEKRTFY
jgi:3-hydroxybutyryl-CoA dehydrogenase